MTRRALLLLPVVSINSVVATAQTESLTQNAIDFNNVFGIFMRKLLGCSEHETDISNCHPQVGEIDYSAFRKCRELAKKLFKLREEI